MLVLATDFDGVIHNPTKRKPGYKLGTPMEGAVEALAEIKAYEHRIIVFCYWASTPAGVKAITDWMDYFKLPYDEVTNIKPDADYYIDNKAIRFESWQQTMRFLKTDMVDRRQR